MNRIALTPLTATVLLIVFSVALGGVVLTWGEDFVSSEATQISNNAVCPIGCVQTSLNGGNVPLNANSNNLKNSNVVGV